MSNTYLITGGAGFIGSHLAYSLLQSGNRVRILDNFSTNSRDSIERLLQDFKDGLTIVDGDIRDTSACHVAAIGADFILHHAGMASVRASIDAPADCIGINVQGTVNLLSEASSNRQIKRLIFASSSAVYGDTPGLSKSESSQVKPLTPYATSKLASEHLCRNFTDIHGLETVCLRYFNVYGERQNPNGDYAAVIPRFLQAVREGRPPKVFGDGNQTRDFVAVADVVQANIKASLAPAEDVSGRVFNIGSGEAISLNQLLETLEQVVGMPISRHYLPPVVGDIRHSLADISEARNSMSFTPSVSLTNALRALLY